MAKEAKSIQYLFRIYHRARDLFPQFAYEGQGPLDGFSKRPCKPFYNEYLLSLPPTLVELSRVASQLVYADLALTVGSQVRRVVVWELSEDDALDATTPVSVFHPFADLDAVNVFYAANFINGFGNINTLPNLTPYRQLGAVAPSNPYLLSYNLVGTSGANTLQSITPDEWHELRYSRKAETGRRQNFFRGRCLSLNDVYKNQWGTLCLDEDGTAYNIRFKIYAALLDGLPYRHTGYSTTNDLKVKRRSIIQGKPVAMGVTDQAAERRQFLLQSNSLAAIYWHFEKAAQEFDTWFLLNEKIGVNHATTVPVVSNPDYSVTYTLTPVNWLKEGIKIASEFINVLGMATGNNSLLINSPYDTALQRQNEYKRLRAGIVSEGDALPIVLQRGGTKNDEILGHMIELVAGIWDELLYFQSNLDTVIFSYPQTTRAETIAKANEIARTHNELAGKWPSIIADLLSVYQLLFSWHLTFRPVEMRNDPNRNTIRGKAWIAHREQLGIEIPYNGARKVTAAPDLFNNFARNIPKMTPFRIWKAQAFGLSDTELDLAAQRDAQAIEMQQKIAARLAAEAAEKTRRYNEAQARIVKLHAQWMKEHVPDPDNIYDWRNWSRKEYWLEELKAPLNEEFVRNTLNVPDELEVAQEFLGTNGGTAAIAVKTEIESEPNQELFRSVAKKRKIPSRVRILRWVIGKVGEQIENHVDERVGETIQRITGVGAPVESPYSDRDIWP